MISGNSIVLLNLPSIPRKTEYSRASLEYVEDTSICKAEIRSILEPFMLLHRIFLKVFES